MKGYRVRAGNGIGFYGFYDEYHRAVEVHGTCKAYDPAATIEEYEYESTVEKVERLESENIRLCDELRKLRGELKWVKEELDKAVEDILDAALTPCTYCLNNPSNGGTCDMYNENHDMFTCWKWRGV